MVGFVVEIELNPTPSNSGPLSRRPREHLSPPETIDSNLIELNQIISNLCSQENQLEMNVLFASDPDQDS